MRCSLSWDGTGEVSSYDLGHGRTWRCLVDGRLLGLAYGYMDLSAASAPTPRGYRKSFVTNACLDHSPQERSSVINLWILIG